MFLIPAEDEGSILTDTYMGKGGNVWGCYRDRPEETRIQREGTRSAKSKPQICSCVTPGLCFRHRSLQSPPAYAGLPMCTPGLRATSSVQSWSTLLVSFLFQDLVPMIHSGAHCPGRDSNDNLRVPLVFSIHF